MQRLFFFIACLVSLSCHPTSAFRTDSDRPYGLPQKYTPAADGYPRIVDSLHVNALYNEAKWKMYYMNCTGTVSWRKRFSNLPRTHFGFMPLVFKGLWRSRDSTEFYFEFYYKDTVPCDWNHTTNDMNIVDGIGFSGKKHKKVYYMKEIARLDHMGNADDKSTTVLQPVVQKFLLRNKNYLDPWFRDMAVKKGMLKPGT